VNTYHKGDTLKFKSINTGQSKLFLITNVETSSGGYGANYSGSLKEAIINYNQINGTDNSTNMLLIWKSKNKTHYIFSFEFMLGDVYGPLLLNTKDTILINNKKYCNFYIINSTDSFSSTKNNWDVIRIYWQEKMGLIKYDLRNGDSFIKTD
jgi:hypothetical protein